MSLTLALLDTDYLEGHVIPTMTECWQQRHFFPARELFELLADRIQTLSEQYPIDPAAILMEKAIKGIPFDKDLWQNLIAELFFFGSEEILDYPLDPELLIVTNDYPMREALFGAKELLFGDQIYRAGEVAYNTAKDVQRLSTYLQSIDPEKWTITEDYHPEWGEHQVLDQLQANLEWFPSFKRFYQNGAERGWVIVNELI